MAGIAGDDDLHMVPPDFSYGSLNQPEKRQNGCNGCHALCCMLMIVALIASIALCAGVAAIVLKVAFLDITSQVKS